MKKAILLIVVLGLMLSLVLTGCSSGGISQEDYDAILAQLADARTQVNQAQADLSSALDGKAAEEAKLQEQIDSLNEELDELKAKYEIGGATTTETVTKLVKAYYESHYYQKGVYDCNNMASDLWDMLKDLGINSVIVIGDIETGVSDILSTTHAWVLADVENGEKLALDATAGRAIIKDENALYYQGWTFNDPAELKRNDDLRTEYNTRVENRNTLAAEVNSAMTLYNNSSTQAEADKYLTLYNKLKELKDAQEAILTQLKAQIDELATKL